MSNIQVWTVYKLNKLRVFKSKLQPYWTPYDFQN